MLPAIRRFTAERHHFRLILSLGSAVADERRRLMPIEGRWPLREVMAAMRDHAAARGERVTLAYVVIGGVNTTPAHAEALGALFGDTRVKLNLIDVTDDTGRYRRATPDELVGVPRRARRARHPGGAPLLGRLGHRRGVRARLAATQQGGTLVPLTRPSVVTRPLSLALSPLRTASRGEGTRIGSPSSPSPACGRGSGRGQAA